jgi:RHS repeat-associated protein
LSGKKREIARTQYEYRTDGLVTRVRHALGKSKSALSDQRFQYDGRGQLTQRGSGGVSRAASQYEYDGFGQLTRENEQAHSYDAAGNRGGILDSAGRVLRDASGEYRYDAEGNVISRRRYSTLLESVFSESNDREVSPGGVISYLPTVTLERPDKEEFVRGYYRLNLAQLRGRYTLPEVQLDVLLMATDLATGETTPVAARPLELMVNDDGTWHAQPLSVDFQLATTSRLLVVIRDRLHTTQLVGPWLEVQGALGIGRCDGLDLLAWNHRQQLQQADRYVPHHPQATLAVPEDLNWLDVMQPVNQTRWKYDALGQLISRQSTGAERWGGWDDVEWYINQAGRPVAIMDGSGAIEQWLVWAPDGSRPMAVEHRKYGAPGRVAPLVVWALSDPDGSVAHAVAQGKSKKILHESYAFDAWGIPAHAPQLSDYPNSLDDVVRHVRYGAAYDPDLQMYFVGTRPYDPVAGRWMTPTVSSGLTGENPYSFQGNDPLRSLTAGVPGRFSTSPYQDDAAPTYTYYLNPLHDIQNERYGSAAIKSLNYTLLAGMGVALGAWAAGPLAGTVTSWSGGLVAGPAAAGAGAYLVEQAGISLVETGLGAGLGHALGDDSALYVPTLGVEFAKNFAVNSLTGGIGGAVRVGAHPLIAAATRQSIEIAADTAIDVHYRGLDFSTALLQNTAGSLLGEAAFRHLSKLDIDLNVLPSGVPIRALRSQIVSGTTRFRGGPHALTKLPWRDGLDSHHMPARSVAGIHPEAAPAIQMELRDHVETSSHILNVDSHIYRAEIAALVQSGRVRTAMAAEIRDVRRAAQAGSNDIRKYNVAMFEMLRYAREIGYVPSR